MGTRLLISSLSLTHCNAPHDPRDEARQDQLWVDHGFVPAGGRVHHEVEGTDKQDTTVVAEQVVHIWREEPTWLWPRSQAHTVFSFFMQPKMVQTWERG